MKAADPVELRQARQALAANGPAATDRSASQAGERAAAAFDLSFNAARLAASGRETQASDVTGEDAALFDSYQKFEAMVLQNFVQSMLPKESATFFGEGTAGEIWKSMMAEQLAAMLAEGGGIGIAQSLMPADGVEVDRPSDDLAGSQHNLAAGPVQELQRATLDEWSGGGSDNDKSGLWG